MRPLVPLLLKTYSVLFNWSGTQRRKPKVAIFGSRVLGAFSLDLKKMTWSRSNYYVTAFKGGSMDLPEKYHVEITVVAANEFEIRLELPLFK